MIAPVNVTATTQSSQSIALSWDAVTGATSYTLERRTQTGGGSVSLTPSGPVTATTNNQVIENLDITATGTQVGIYINGMQSVTIRNCRIRYATGQGIYAQGNFNNLLIEDCDIETTSAQAAGPNPNSDMNNITLWGDGALRTGVILRRLRLRKGSSGVYARFCSGILVEQIEGYDFRGPFPRGQVVQFHLCTAPTLQDFSVISTGNTSWTEDNVNLYGCTNPIVRRGLVVGNNSPSGVGVLVENNAGGSGGLIEDVDVINWGNGGFSGADASTNVTFRRCRARDGITRNTPWINYLGVLWGNISASRTRDDQPMAGGQEAFMTWQNGTGLRFEECKHWNLADAAYWFHNPVEYIDITSQNFTARSATVLTMPWENWSAWGGVATPTANSFTDTGLQPSTTYQYRVAAVDATGPSDWSATAEAATTYRNVIMATMGVLSYWNMQEKTGTVVADSVSTVTGAMQAGVTGGAMALLADPADSSLEYTLGSGHVTFGNNYTFLNTAPFSVELWMRTRTITATFQRLVSKDWFTAANNRGGWSLSITNTSNNSKIRFARSRNNTPNLLDSVVAATANTTYHVVGTYDGATMSLYVNGVLVSSLASTLNIPNTDLYELMTGRRSDTAAEYFDGFTNHVATYNRALTPTEVADHHTLGTTVPSNALQRTATATQTQTASTIATSSAIGPGALVFPQTWTGANGTSWPSGWTVGSSATATIQSNRGQLSVPGAVAVGNVYATGMNTMTNMAVRTLVRRNNLSKNYFHLTIRHPENIWTAANLDRPYNGYAFGFGSYNDNAYFELNLMLNGVRTTLNTKAAPAFDADTDYYIYVEAVGTTIRGRMWLASNPEPTTWDISVTDSTHASGRISVSSASDSEPGTSLYTLDDMNVTVPSSATTIQRAASATQGQSASTVAVLRRVASASAAQGQSAIVTLQPTSTGSYSIQFTPSNVYSTATNELAWQVRTATGTGGTLLASGTATANVVRTTPTFIDNGLVHGPNTRWLRITSGSGHVYNGSFIVNAQLNVAPTITVAPTVSYGALTRLGPNNTPAIATFTATDPEQTGAGALNYELRTAVNGGGALVGSGTATSGVTKQHSIANSATGLVDGTQALHVRVFDGISYSADSAVTLLRDTGAPTVSAISYTPNPVQP